MLEITYLLTLDTAKTLQTIELSLIGVTSAVPKLGSSARLSTPLLF